MRNDELLRFIHKARIADFHIGEHKLEFRTYIKDLVLKKPKNITIGKEGIFRNVDEGTPKERRIPIKPNDNYFVWIKVSNAPKVHKGQNLEKNDPLTICEIALDYYSDLVYEAKNRFALSKID